MNWLRETLSAQSGRMSSKRVCGAIGFIACIGVMIYCTIKMIEAPTISDMILFSCMGLLGVDSVTSIWKGKS